MSLTQHDRTDLIIVGAGIVGLAHAYEAHRAGLRVRILERDWAPNGASIRNFGHCCITAQEGPLLDTAYRSRKGWLNAARDVGFWSPEAGAVVVARSALEMEVLQQLTDKRGSDAVLLLTDRQVIDRIGKAGEPDPRICGGAFLPADLRVDPRTTAQTIARWLEEQQGVAIEWNTSVKDIRGGDVLTSRGDFTADRVLVCVGHDIDYLYPAIADEYEIQRCALQMAQAPAPSGWDVDSAVLTGTSMTRYDGFTTMPAADDLRREIQGHSPELIDMVANVMFTRLPDGTLLLGDSHIYGRTIPPFLDDAITTRLVNEISGIIGAPIAVSHHWQGVYANSSRTSLVVHDIDATTRAIVVTSGIGMTMSFGIAADTLSSW